MPPSPLVSILIPCHNAERWIGQAIESALGQDHPNKEVIVADDGSTDASPEIINRYAERIRILVHPQRGGNATRNRLLREACGEWLQYLDADDYLMPGKISAQVKALSPDDDADVIYSPVLFELWSGGRVHREKWTLPPEPHDPWILLARWKLPQTGGALWRKGAIEQAGAWDEKLPCCQEHELYFRLLASKARFRFVPDAEAVYRRWSYTTVCTADSGRTRRVRLRILNRMEKHLRNTGQLTHERLHALNLTRFESARLMWLDDAPAALRLIRRIHREEPSFAPHGNAAPLLYRLVYRLAGFQTAERVAHARRNLAGAPFRD